MRRRATVTGFLVSAAVVIAACGHDSTPTTSSDLSSGGASTLSAGSSVAHESSQASVTVAEILANPSPFTGQSVELLGKLVQPLSEQSFLFTDGTGAIPADFDPGATVPALNEVVQLEGTVTAGSGDFSARIKVLSWEAEPPFNCEQVVEVRARFSDPGFVAGNVVGLYLAFLGVPPGQKTLRIDWGDGESDTAELGEGRSNGEGLFDLEGVVGHEYQNLKGTESKSARADLYIEGRQGSCSRVRDVTVSPGSGPGFAAGGNLRLTFDDPVSSGGFFAVSADVTNPVSQVIDVQLVFDTPDGCSIRTMGSECRAINDQVVECRVDGIAGNGTGGTYVQYDVPVVTEPTTIRGSVTLVSRDFSPVAGYSTTVRP